MVEQKRTPRPKEVWAEAILRIADDTRADILSLPDGDTRIPETIAVALLGEDGAVISTDRMPSEEFRSECAKHPKNAYQFLQNPVGIVDVNVEGIVTFYRFGKDGKPSGKAMFGNKMFLSWYPFRAWPPPDAP